MPAHAPDSVDELRALVEDYRHRIECLEELAVTMREEIKTLEAQDGRFAAYVEEVRKSQQQVMMKLHEVQHIVYQGDQTRDGE